MGLLIIGDVKGVSIIGVISIKKDLCLYLDVFIIWGVYLRGYLLKGLLIVGGIIKVRFRGHLFNGRCLL